MQIYCTKQYSKSVSVTATSSAEDLLSDFLSAVPFVATILETVFQNSTTAAAVTTAVATPVALAALTPAPLPMYPPLGLPQPGALAQGGGALPVPATFAVGTT